MDSGGVKSASTIEDHGEAFPSKRKLKAEKVASLEPQSTATVSIGAAGRSRTEWLTSTLTLKCYYCDSGFLIPANRDNSGDNATGGGGSSFVCIDCSKSFKSLEFIVRLCAQLEEEFQYWRADFETKGQPDYALERMAKFHRELANCISEQNLKLVEVTLQLAECYNRKEEFENAIQLNHSAIRTLLTYGQEYLHHNGKIATLCQMIADISSGHQQFISHNGSFDSYLEDGKQLDKLAG